MRQYKACLHAASGGFFFAQGSTLKKKMESHCHIAVATLLSKLDGTLSRLSSKEQLKSMKLDKASISRLDLYGEDFVRSIVRATNATPLSRCGS